MKREPSEKMQKVYAEKRAETIKKVQDAIDFIQSEGREVTKKELMDITELSSACFSKDHIKEVLEKNQVCQFKPLKKIVSEKKEETQTQIIEKLSKEIKAKDSSIQSLQIALEKKTNDLKKLDEKHNKLEKDYALLKGKYQQALEFLEVSGVDLTKFNVI